MSRLLVQLENGRSATSLAKLRVTVVLGQGPIQVEADDQGMVELEVPEPDLYTLHIGDGEFVVPSGEDDDRAVVLDLPDEVFAEWREATGATDMSDEEDEDEDEGDNADEQ